jgi:hypothetical protein
MSGPDSRQLRTSVPFSFTLISDARIECRTQTRKGKPLVRTGWPEWEWIWVAKLGCGWLEWISIVAPAIWPIPAISSASGAKQWV